MIVEDIFYIAGVNVDARPFDPGPETLYIIEKTSRKAKEINRTLYLIEKGFFIYVTSSPGENDSIVAVCYPGGRKHYRKVK